MSPQQPSIVTQTRTPRSPEANDRDGITSPAEAVDESRERDREIPSILHHDKSIKVKLDAVVKAFR